MKRQSFENIFFVGDAFHSVHPVLGQGFNMSAKDVILLCNEIEKAQKRGIPFERVTRNLPRKNIINHFKIGFATHFFGKAFLVENKIMEKITSGSILLGSVVPSGLKTKILSKLL
jgi:2-polyprenyl-6-methoxyphenol hydroxylase-like FAD-dependent oxidoreductase